MFPLWCWTIDPTLRILTASYAYSLSLDHCIRSRDILRSNKFRQLFPDIRIKKDEDNKSHYRNTEGGERMATSVGGSVTGFHAHLLIVDDPLKRTGSPLRGETPRYYPFYRSDHYLPVKWIRISPQRF